MKLYHVLSQLIAHVSGRMLIGLPRSRGPQWIDTVVTWTNHVFLSALKLRLMPSFLRPVLYPFVLDSRKINSQRAYVKDIVTSVLDPTTTRKPQETDIMINWLIESGHHQPSYLAAHFGGSTHHHLGVVPGSLRTRCKARVSRTAAGGDR